MAAVTFSPLAWFESFAKATNMGCSSIKYEQGNIHFVTDSKSFATACTIMRNFYRLNLDYFSKRNNVEMLKDSHTIVLQVSTKLSVYLNGITVAEYVQKHFSKNTKAETESKVVASEQPKPKLVNTTTGSETESKQVASEQPKPELVSRTARLETESKQAAAEQPKVDTSFATRALRSVAKCAEPVYTEEDEDGESVLIQTVDPNKIIDRKGYIDLVDDNKDGTFSVLSAKSRGYSSTPLSTQQVKELVKQAEQSLKFNGVGIISEEEIEISTGY